MARTARIAPPSGGMKARPFEGASPAWLYVQNGILSGQTVRSREGSALYVDPTTYPGEGSVPNQRGRLLVPYRDPRGYRLLIAGRDSGTTFRVAVFSGTNQVGAPLTATTAGIGFPAWARLDDRIYIARPGDPLRAIGIDDGGEPFMEDVRALDRDATAFKVSFDDFGPYLALAPTGQLVVALNDRLWVIDKERAHVSNALGDTEGWPASNELDLGDECRAAGTLGSLVVFAFTDGFATARGDPGNGFTSNSFGYGRVVAAEHGCTAPRSMVNIAGRIWFLAQTGEVCVFTGSSTHSVTAKVSDYLRPQTPLAIDPLNFPRSEAPGFNTASAVWYQPWEAYVLFIEGQTAGVFDLAFCVNVRTYEVSVLTGIDAQAAAVMHDDPTRMLTVDRFGVVSIQDRGVVDHPVTEAFDGGLSAYVHTYPETRVPFIAVPHPTPLASTGSEPFTALRFLLEHRDARAPSGRIVTDTLELRETFRIEINRPFVSHGTAGAPLTAGYLAHAGADNVIVNDARDFIIGTTPVQGDGSIDGNIGISGAAGRNASVVIRNDVLAATAEVTADLPDQVGLTSADWVLARGGGP